MAYLIVVDDDDSYRDYVAAILKSAGHRVVLASTAQQVIALAAADSPDLVVADINMPGISGLELVERLNAADGGRWVPVILMSAMNDREALTSAFRAGAVDYLIKPFKRAEMIDSVARKLVEAERRRQSQFESELATRPAPGVPGYRILRTLGRGGMGEVHLAERVGDGLQCALKLLTLFDEGRTQTAAIARFLEERAILARIDHPGVARVFDHGICDDHIFIVMEYFPCGDLRQAIERGLPVSSAICIVREIAAALAAVHEQGVIHRDIKPANIMLRTDGSVALVDFGIAKSLDATHTLTREGDAMGTPHYMSPEQIQGGDLDARADLYSVGALFYEMLTRQKPYSGERVESILMQHLQSGRPQLPAGLSILQPLLDKLMAVNRDLRFADPQDLLRSLAVMQMMQFSDDLLPERKQFIGLADMDTLSGWQDSAATPAKME
jgi:serine/threonine protein kinase